MAKEQAGVGLSPEQASTLIVYAETFGNARAAKAFNVATRTVQRYLKQEREGELPSATGTLVAEKRKRLREELGDDCVRFVRHALKKMGELVDAAKPGELGALREVAGALKVVFEANLVKEVLSGGQLPGADQQGPPAAEASGGDPASGSRSGVH